MPEEKEKTIPVRVALRIRPLVPKETGDGCQECIRCVPGNAQVVIGDDKSFTYDYVFGTTSKQEELYSETVIPLLEGFFKGYNATVLAYGQTGSGKTYSMGTAFTMCNEASTEERGVIPRLIQTVFDWIDQRKDTTTFLLKASFLEIHNEEIHDLLNPCSPEESKIAIRESHDGGIKIAGLQEVTVTSGADMVRCLEQGSASRATGATAMNSRSSRSHAIFTITLEQKELQGSELKKAKFHLVDLAGSERVKKTHAQGERFKEGVNINKGLLALGNVISALSDELRKSNAHVPYRDSKLTRLLQDSLGGNSNTMMIACVSPADSNFEETLNTLRYADRARQIKNKPIVNLDPAAAELARLRQQVQLLQMQLIQGQTITGANPGGTSCENTAVNIQEMADRIAELESENEKLSAELHASVDQNTQMYEKVLVAELTRDKMFRKFNELKSHLSSKVDATVADSKDDVEPNVTLVEELQTKLHELEDTFNSTTQLEDVKNEDQNTNASLEHPDECDDGSCPSSPSDASFVSQHALRQAELGRQLQELTKALAMKEELANKMVANDSRLTSMRKQYEDTVRELEGEISRLEKEKANLNVALSNAKTENSDSKTKEKNKSRIKELEAKILELKKKQVEQQKLLKLKEQSDSTIKKLNSEIQGMKSIRVKLMRQMKEESERFRALKAQKEKEINQLKQQGRKRQFEYKKLESIHMKQQAVLKRKTEELNALFWGRKRQFEYKKLESIHMKQQAVLKRKTEEVTAVQKRLKMALDRQKEAAEKRSTHQQQQQKQAEGLLPRMKSWLSHEVEVLVSVGQARQTLESLIEDRKALSRQLAELRTQEQDEDDEPAAKKMVQDGGTPSDKKNKSHDLQKKITGLEHEMELRSAQIAGLQRKLLDAEQGEKSKHRWNNIHTMAEAKAGLQALLSMAVAAKLVNATADKSREESEQMCQELMSREQSTIQEHQAEIAKLEQSHDNLMTRLKEEHEEKVQCLLQQITSHDNSQQQLQEQLEALRHENNKLNEQLKQLMDVFATDSPSANSPLPQQKEKKLKSSQIIEVEDDDWAMGLSDESEIEDSIERDPDWVKTPVQRRSDRRTRSTETSSLSLLSDSGRVQGCSCTGKCARNNCPCKKSASSCSENCGCKTVKCVNRQPKSLQAVPTLDTIPASDVKNELSPSSKTESEERKALIEVKNIPPLGIKKSDKKTIPPSIKKNGTENQPHLNKPPKVFHKPHSSSSVSSSDEELRQRGFSRPGTTPGRSVLVHGKPRTPGFSFGSAKKVGRRKSITKFHPENKRKRKLMKPVNNTTNLGVKL